MNIHDIINVIMPDASDKEVAKYRTKINTYIKKYKIIYKKENNKIVLSKDEADKVIAHFGSKLKDSTNVDYRKSNSCFEELETKIREQQAIIDNLQDKYLIQLEKQNEELIATNRELSSKFDKLMQLVDQQQQLHGRDQQISDNQSQLSGNDSNNAVEAKSLHWWEKIFK